MGTGTAESRSGTALQVTGVTASFQKGHYWTVRHSGEKRAERGDEVSREAGGCTCDGSHLGA